MTEMTIEERQQVDDLFDTSKLIGWLVEKEYDLRTHREMRDEEGSSWWIYWTVVNPRTGKALSHPMGSPAEAIREARKSEIDGLQTQSRNRQDCPDCRAAKRHAYSDATTPGFFYTTCDRHRESEA